MSKLIKNSRGFMGLGIFIVALWAIVVVSYARQIKQGDATQDHLRLLTDESCSSGSSGNSSGSGEP